MKSKYIFFNEDSGAFKHGDLIEIQISDDFKDDDIVFYEVGGRCEHDIYSSVVAKNKKRNNNLSGI